MKKMDRICLLLLLMVIGLFGCSKGEDWTSGEIKVNGTEITLPFAYQELADIRCASADLYYNNMSDQYVFNKGEEQPQLMVLDTVKKGYLSVGCVNVAKTPCTLPNVKVYRIAAEANNDKTRADIVLPSDISWGATAEDIIDAYGEPNGAGKNQSKSYEAETGITRLAYHSGSDSLEKMADSSMMILEVHDKKGLCKFEYTTGYENAGTENESGNESAVIEKRIETSQPDSAQIPSLQEKWQQPSVQFDGKSFGFPMTVNDLKEIGFTFSDAGKKSVFNPENTESRTMTSGQYGEITVDLINLDTKLRTPDTVWVDEIILDAAKLKDPSRVRVTGGIGFGDSADTVAAVFQGGPEAVRSEYPEGDAATGENVEYSLAEAATENSLYRFGIDSQKGVQKITIRKHHYKFAESKGNTGLPQTGTKRLESTDSGLTATVTLPEKVAAKYEKAKYYILKRDAAHPDSYLLAGGGADVSLNGKELSSSLQSNVVRVADKTAGKTYDTSVYLREETDTERLFVTDAILQRDSVALGGHHDTQTLDASVTVRQDKKTGDCKPLDAKINQENLSSMASRVQLNLNLFQAIRYGVTLYTPQKNEDGSLKPVKEWIKNPDIQYSDYIPENEYEIQLQNVSGEGDYAVVFEVTDQDGQVYVSEIQKIQ